MYWPGRVKEVVFVMKSKALDEAQVASVAEAVSQRLRSALTRIEAKLDDIQTSFESAGAIGASERREYLTVKEAAQILRVSPRTIEKCFQDDRLTRFKFGRRTLIDRLELKQMLTKPNNKNAEVYEITSKILEGIRGEEE